MAFTIAVVVMGSGCANWKESNVSIESVAKLTSGQDPAAGTTDEIAKHGKRVTERGATSSSNQVILEVDFVNFQRQKFGPDESAALWQWVDETVVNVGQRQKLLANGLRAGLVVQESRFRKQLDSLAGEKDVVDEFLASASVASDVHGGAERIPMRIGRRYELPLRKPIEGSLVSLVKLGDQIEGRTLENPQFLFAVRPLLLSARHELHLQFRPEIQHGQMQQKWVGAEFAMRIDRRRESWSLPELDLDFVTRQDDLIVIGADRDFSENDALLANQMLVGDNADHRKEQLVVLVRVAQVPKISPLQN